MKRTLVTLGLATLLLAAFACERRDAGGGPTTTADSGGTILVGVYGDLSGQTSSFGESTRNVKIITRNGHVTLRGTVKTRAERASIQQSAQDAAGNGNVTNEIEVAE